MALAMIMLPTGMSAVMAVSMTPAQVMMAVTRAGTGGNRKYVETLRAPGMFLARRAEIEPAATIIPASRNTLDQRGALSSSTSTEPTMTI